MVMMSRAPKLDRIDINILAELQKSGRMTNAQLSDQVGLSPSPCLARVKRLEDAGYITGYGAWIDLSKLGPVQVVFASVTLSDHKLPDFTKFERGIADIPEILECHLVSGGFDYLVKFVVRSVSHYQDIIERILEKNIGVNKYFSYIVIKSPVNRPYSSIKSLKEP